MVVCKYSVEILSRIDQDVRQPLLPDSSSESGSDDSYEERLSIIKNLELDVKHMSLMLQHMDHCARLKKKGLLIKPKKIHTSERNLDSIPELGLHPDSAEPMPASSLSTENGDGLHQLVEFAGGDEELVVDMAPVVDATRRMGLDNNTDLAQFLSRPVIVHQIPLDIGTKISIEIFPWSHYLSAAPIQRKIQNFRFLRGTMVVKFLINAGPTYYGNLIAAYSPKNWQNHNTPVLTDYKLLLPQLSQRPHIILDPTNSQGGVLRLPFVSDKDYLTITNETTDPLSFGTVNIASIYALTNTQTTTARTINITVMAHLEDVELCVPTTRAPYSESGLWPDSDEYGTGIVSKSATAIARYAGMLSTVPKIGPYAMATSSVAGGFAKMASYFGYCRPVNIDPVRKYRPTYLGNLANTSIEEAVDKLTLDPKQGLTIDPSIIGKAFSEDELAITTLVQKESFIDSFDWDSDATPYTLMWSTRVRPQTNAIKQGPTDVEQMTPMSMVANLFQTWRGSITYRFMVQASAFHRGRLMFVYRPDASSVATLGPLVPSEVYTRIVDISSERNFELTVNWQQSEQFLYTDWVAATDAVAVYSPEAIGAVAPASVGVVTLNPLTDNGTLSVYVLNELTSLNEGAAGVGTANIAWHIRGGPDLEFGSPHSAFTDDITFQPTRVLVNRLEYDSGLWPDSSAELSPVATSKMDITTLEPIGRPTDFPAQSLINYGESFHSLRDLFKRYMRHGLFITQVDDNPDLDRDWYIRYPNFPTMYGADNTAGMMQNRTTTGVTSTNRFNPFRMPHYAYMAYAFHARRGGIRWKYSVTTTDPNLPNVVLSLQRNVMPLAAEFTERLQTYGFDSSTNELRIQNLLAIGRTRKDTLAGAAATQVAVNPTLEVELPFYHKTRYAMYSSAKQTIYEDAHLVNLMAPEHTANTSLGLESWTATGEDFSLSWFINAPSFMRQTFSTGA